MGRVGRGLLVIAWVATLGAGAEARQATFRSGTELVTLNVAVLGGEADGRGRYVTGLQAEQFEVRENGVPQPLRFFAAGELPLDLVLVLDLSTSMRDDLTFVQQAAVRFARTLRPGDRAAVMGIQSGLRVLQPLTSEHAAVERAIRGTQAGGTTPLYASLYVALTELARTPGDNSPRRQAIVVLSDGADTGSAFPFAALLDAARRRGVAIYPIAPRPTRAAQRVRELATGQRFGALDFDLRTLAGDSGGRAFFPTRLKDLDAVYADIAHELASQYSLAFLPSLSTRHGEFRRISVRVPGTPLICRTRSGYLADASPAAAFDR
ncbi:MAG: VWA domain-containing protein [Acidobacteriota bacterium]